jgi:endonuclease III
MGVLDGDGTGIEVDAHLDRFAARLAEIVLQEIGAVKSRLLRFGRLQCQAASNDQ